MATDDNRAELRRAAHGHEARREDGIEKTVVLRRTGVPRNAEAGSVVSEPTSHELFELRHVERAMTIRSEWKLRVLNSAYAKCQMPMVGVQRKYGFFCD